jgi:hypothetical protein
VGWFFLALCLFVGGLLGNETHLLIHYIQP